jgi:hypothetical protein
LAKAIIQRLPGRIFAYHVKDTPDGKMTSVGEGTIDFADYVESQQSPRLICPTSKPALPRSAGSAHNRFSEGFSEWLTCSTRSSSARE